MSRHPTARILRWRVATLALLGLTVIISLSADRVIDAVIAGVLVIPSLVALGLWIFAWRRHRI